MKDVLRSLAILAVACSGPAPSVARSGGGVSLRVVHGARERFRLSSSTLEIFVEGGAGMHAGHIRSMERVGEGDPRPGHVAFGIDVDGRLYAMDEVAVHPVSRNRRPALRVEGVVHASGGRVYRLATEIHLHPTRPAVTLRSRVRQTSGPRRGSVRIVDVADWGGATAFVPGVGLVSQERRLPAQWIARAGLATYAFVPREGLLDVWARAEPHGPKDLVLGSVALSPDGGLHDRRILFATVLSEVAAWAWFTQGQVHRRAFGRVIGPLQGVDVAAIDENGALEALTTPSADGTFEVCVRPGRYRMIAEGSAGGAETWVDATEDVETLLDIPDGGRLVVSVRGGTEDYLPARVILRGVPPTPNPDLGPHERADGAQESICLADGPAEIPLRPGRYRLTATHGPEWSIETKEITVPDGRVTPVGLELRHQVETPDSIGADFHVHASPSPDSLVSLPDRVRSLLCEGVELAVPTDHNHVTDYAATIEALGVGARLGTVPGVEITSKGPFFGHFNAYPVDRSRGSMPFPFAETTPAEVFASVREQFPGAVVQVNHPRMGGEIGYFEVTGFDATRNRARERGYSSDFDAIEVWNGLELHRPERVERNLADWMELLRLGVRYTATGNSDSHLVHWHWVGYPRSYVTVPDGDAATFPTRLAEAVRGGKVLVTNGPFVDLEVDGATPGETLHPAAETVTARVRVRAASWVDTTVAELVVGGQVAARWEIGVRDTSGVRGEWTHEIPVRQKTFVIAIVRGERSSEEIHPGRSSAPLAFTNPVFVEP